MVQSCSIKNCKSIWNPENKISFHRFPAEKKEIAAKWMENIPKDLLPRPTKSTIICSKHFDSKCYEIGSFFRKKLLKDAVPTIFALNVNKENNDSQLIQIDDQKLLLHNNPSSVDALPLNEVSNIVIINESNPTMEKNQNFPELLKRNAMDLAVQVEDENFFQSPKAKKNERYCNSSGKSIFTSVAKNKTNNERKKDIATTFETKGQISSIYEVISEVFEKKW